MEEKKIIGYDAQTGEPIYEEVSAAEPVAEAAPETVNEETTAQAAEETAPVQEPVNSYVEETAPVYTEASAEATADNKKKMGLVIIGIAAALVIAIVVLLIVFVFAKKPKDIVNEACENTFASFSNGDNLLFTAFSPEGFDKASECTITMEGSIEDTWAEEEVTFDVNVAADESKLQIYGGIDLSEVEELPYIDAVIELNDSKLLVASSLLKNVYAYDYTEECDGAIADYLEEEDIPTSMINDMLAGYYAQLNNAIKNPEQYEEYVESFEEVIDNLEYEKIDAEDFEVDGKDRSCKGYKMIITSDDMADFMEAYKELINSAMDENFTSSFEELTGESYEDIMDEAFDEIYGELEDMDDVEINFYVYNKALAAITCEVEGEELEIAFLGGDYRAQNMTIGAAGTKLKISSEIEDGVETLTVKFAKEEVFSYEYDAESGDLTINVLGEEISGINIRSDKKEWVLSFDDLEFEDIKINGLIKITTEAEFEDLDGDEVVINDLSEDDLMDVIMDEAEAFEELMY